MTYIEDIQVLLGRIDTDYVDGGIDESSIVKIFEDASKALEKVLRDRASLRATTVKWSIDVVATVFRLIPKVALHYEFREGRYMVLEN